MQVLIGFLKNAESSGFLGKYTVERSFYISIELSKFSRKNAGLHLREIQSGIGFLRRYWVIEKYKV